MHPCSARRAWPAPGDPPRTSSTRSVLPHTANRHAETTTQHCGWHLFEFLVVGDLLHSLCPSLGSALNVMASPTQVQTLQGHLQLLSQGMMSTVDASWSQPRSWPCSFGLAYCWSSVAMHHSVASLCCTWLWEGTAVLGTFQRDSSAAGCKLLSGKWHVLCCSRLLAASGIMTTCTVRAVKSTAMRKTVTIQARAVLTAACAGLLFQ
jgi:hypothetical protein